MNITVELLEICQTQPDAARFTQAIKVIETALIGVKDNLQRISEEYKKNSNIRRLFSNVSNREKFQVTF